MIEHKYSTFWPRVCAGFIDTLIFLPIGMIYTPIFTHLDSIPLRVLACIIHSSAFLAYSIWMHGACGQTLGKMACGVIVLDSSERSLSMKQAVLRDIFGVVLLPIGLARDIAGIVEGIDITAQTDVSTFGWILAFSALGWGMVEIITMLTNDKRRALHDFIAGSVVVRLPATLPQLTDAASKDNHISAIEIFKRRTNVRNIFTRLALLFWVPALAINLFKSELGNLFANPGTSVIILQTIGLIFIFIA